MRRERLSWGGARRGRERAEGVSGAPGFATGKIKSLRITNTFSEIWSKVIKFLTVQNQGKFSNKNR
jgi:hypothetical protein